MRTPAFLRAFRPESPWFPLHRFTWLAGCLLLLASGLQAALPSGFSDTAVAGPAGGWTEAVGVKFEANGRMYVWERGGRVWFKEATESGFNLLLDLAEEVMPFLDHGLIDFTLDPNFRLNGFIYVSYAVDRHHLLYYGTPSYNPATTIMQAATIGRVTRYTCRAADGFRSVDPGSRRILIGDTKQSGIPVLSDTHFGGALVFGMDGSLLVSTGDGASPYGADMGGAAPSGYAVQGLADGIIRAAEDVGAYRCQLIDSLSGKILRIDPATGDGLPSNPFYDASRPRSAQSRVFSLGLRNPFRMTLSPGSGSHDPADANPGVLLIGDVGWNTWEEFNVMTGPRQNFGWPLFEGNFHAVLGSYTYNVPVTNRDAPNPLWPGTGSQYFNFTDLLKQDTLAASGQPPFSYSSNPSVKLPASVPQFLQRRPALDWNHNNDLARVPIYDASGAAQTADLGSPSSPVTGTSFRGNCAVGGIWYTGTSFPATYHDTYFQADWGTGIIKNIVLDASYRPTAVRDFLSGGGFVTGMAQHPQDGSLYYVQFNYSASTVRRIAYTSNQPPTAVATADRTFGPEPLTVQFSGAASSDPDGGALTFAWNFGDGSAIVSQASPAHTFPSTAGAPAGYTVTLTVTDSTGASSQSQVRVAANGTPPAVTLLSPADGSSYDPLGSTTVSLTALVQDTESPEASLSYEWYTILHHNDHTHSSPADPAHASSTILSPTGPDDGVSLYYYEILLVVTDPQGLTTTRSAQINPDYAGINSAPAITALPNQFGAPGSAIGPLAFTVGDAETPAGSLTVGGVSSNPILVPAGNIVFGGSGSSRTVTLTPAAGQTGTATITLTASDGSLSASTGFTVTIAAGPANGLVAAYNFDAGTGTSLSDLSGQGNTGAISGATWTTSGRYGGALVFNGSSNLVAVNAAPSLNLSTAMTIEAWVYPTASQTGWRAIVQREVDTYFLHASSNGALQPAAGGTFGSTVAFVGSPTAVPVGAWTHLAVTYDQATLRLYVNGVQVASQARTGTIPSATGALRIGGNVPYGEYFLGRIDDVRLYNRALAAAEIQSDMNTPVASPGALPAPVITSPLTAAGVAGASFNYAIAATNSPGSYGATGLPAGLTVATTTGVISGIPSLAGSYPVTLTATNASGTGTALLSLTISPGTPTNTAPTVSAIANQTTVAGLPVGPIGFTIGDAETAAGSLTVSGTSSNLALVPAANLSFGGTGALRTLTITPAAGQTGAATITVTVGDGALSTAVSFTLTVNSTSGNLPGLAASYGFNEGVGMVLNDLSGNANQGTISGATWSAAGRHGGALAFNGTSDVVLINASPSLNFSTAMTIEAWVYPTGAQSGWRTIVQREVDTYLLHAGSNSALVPAGGGTIGGVVSLAAGTAPISVNTWSHLAVTYDQATVRLYVNGVQVASQSRTGNIQTTSSLLRLGGNVPYGEFFLGLIDDVRLYNRALSAAEIQADLNAAVGVASASPVIFDVANQVTTTNSPVGPVGVTIGDPDTPLGALVLSGSSSNPLLIPNANIVFGGSEGSRTVTITPATGQTGTATLTLSVSDGYSAATITFNVTVNPPAPVITSPLTATGAVGLAFSYAITATNSPAAYGAAGLPGGLSVNPGTGVISGVPSVTGNFAVTITATNVTGTGSATLALTINSSAPANTAPTITAIADQTTTTNTPVGPIAFTVGDAETAAGSLVVSGATSNQTLVPNSGISFGGSGTSRTVTTTPASGQTGAATVTVTVSDGQLSTARSFTLTVNPATGTGLVASYNFNEGSGTVLTDRSGNANTGTIMGATWTTAGKYGGALTFNGSSNLVVVNASPSLNLTNAMTIEAWVYPTASQSKWRTIVQRERDAYFLHAGSNAALRPAGGGTLNGAMTFAAATTAIPTNSWTHLAVTYDGAAVRLYVNGAQVASKAQTGPIQATTAPLRIGGNVPYGEYFLGRIDEIRLYNRALSATELQADLSTPLP
jgi:glucose/arabinose dehydrogenase